MGRLSGWVFAIVLLWASPGSTAPSVCHGQSGAPVQGDKAAAKPGDPKKPEHRPKWWQGEGKTELGISNLQSSEIEQIFQSTLPKLEAAKQKLDKLEDVLSRTVKDNTADLATLGHQLDQVNTTRAELSKTRTLMLYRMRGALTGEQRQKLQAMMDRLDAARRKSNEGGRR
jgi:Spy/CpxP family protein refolding chaperone